MDSVEDKILTSVKKCGRGKVFFSSEFLRYGTAKRINKALELLSEKGLLMRVARGLYCYPKQEKIYGLGAVPPMVEEIASAIARRDASRVVPTGEWAQYQLGLTQQIPMNIVYLTDGTSRTIELLDGRKIKFKHSASKNFAFKDRTAMLVTSALKSIGKGNITDELVNVLDAVLSSKNVSFSLDLHLMPEWVRKIIQDRYEKIS